jgi:hypothetical protein
MELPENFSSPPHEHLQKTFHKLVIEFRKTVQRSKDISELTEQMDRLLNASKEMTWIVHNSDIYHKHEGPKAMERLFTEFERYINHLQSGEKISPVDLIASLKEIEEIIEKDKIL